MADLRAAYTRVGSMRPRRTRFGVSASRRVVVALETAATTSLDLGFFARATSYTARQLAVFATSDARKRVENLGFHLPAWS